MTTSGFLFPFPLSLLYSLTGLTTGAFSLFLIAKTAISNVIRKNMPLFFHKISKEIEENKINYLLFLRLMPLIPSWIINLIPAFFSIPPFTYIWTTFIGSIPIALIYTYAGQELREIFNSDQSVYFQLILNTNMKLALLALALLSLFPIFIKHFSSKRKKKDSK